MQLPATEYIASLAWFSESALVRLAQSKHNRVALCVFATVIQLQIRLGF